MSTTEEVEGRLVEALAAWAEAGVPAGAPAPATVLALAGRADRPQPDEQLDAPDAPDAPEDLDTHPAAVLPLRRHRQVLALVAVAAAAVLVVAGTLVGVRALRPHRADPAQRVASLLSVFDRPATAADRLPAAVLDGAGADFTGSRYLGGASLDAAVRAQFWAAVQGDGQICLVTRVSAPTTGTTTDCATPDRFAGHGTTGSAQEVDPSTEKKSGLQRRETLYTYLLPDSGRGRAGHDTAHEVAPGVHAQLSTSGLTR